MHNKCASLLQNLKAGRSCEVQPPSQGSNSPCAIPDRSLCLDTSKDRNLTPYYSLSNNSAFICTSPESLHPNPHPNPRLTLQLRETQSSSIERPHPLTLGRNVPLQQPVLLQQVLGLHQVLPTLPGQQLSLGEGAARSLFLALAIRLCPPPPTVCDSLCSSSLEL